MAENSVYIAIGEEATRGTAESSTVGFVPTVNTGVPAVAFDEVPRDEFRGEDAAKGVTAFIRRSTSWTGSLEIPFFTEGGVTKGIMGTIIKHFFGHVNTAQNATTGQYAHMFSPVADPFASTALGTKALTINANLPEGATIKNWPFVGGRVKSLTFDQEPGQTLKMTAEMFGQKRNASATAIASPTYAAENLRCDFNNLTIREGATVTRTGTAPNYTNITSTGNIIKADKVSIKIENGMEDVLRLSGLDYPDKTRINGRYKVSMEITLDWDAPGSGFDTVAEVTSWIAAASSTNFVLTWDTGMQAGTGDNHSLIIDLPTMQRMGGDPDLALDKDPMVTLKYEGVYTAAQAYSVGVLLKSTATAV